MRYSRPAPQLILPGMLSFAPLVLAAAASGNASNATLAFSPPPPAGFLPPVLPPPHAPCEDPTQENHYWFVGVLLDAIATFAFSSWMKSG